MRHRKPLAQRYLLHCEPSMGSPGPDQAPGLSQGSVAFEEGKDRTEGTA